MEVDGGNNGNHNEAKPPPPSRRPSSSPLLRRATLRIRYAVSSPDPRSGLRFWGSSGSYAHTSPGEPYCARAWLPTVDDPRASFPLDTRVTVLDSLTAIAPGVLRRLRPAPPRKEDRLRRRRRTFVFECSLALPASMAAVVVGPYCRVDDGEEKKGEAPTKNEAAVELERLGGLKGGKAKAEKLTALQRRKMAIKAAHAKWKKNNPK